MLNMSFFTGTQLTHGCLLKSGLRYPIAIWNNLLKAYCYLGHTRSACQVFAEMPERDAYSWNIVIYASARSGWIGSARQLFDENPMKCTISWNCMMSAYNSNGCHTDVLKLFAAMHQHYSSRSRFSFGIVLNACAKSLAKDFSMQVHTDIIRVGLASNHIVGSALIRAYSSHNMLADACHAFKDVSYKDDVLWTSIISAHAQNKNGIGALHLFQLMENEGKKPTELTYSSIINSCTSLSALKQGTQTHARVLKSGHQYNLIIATALIDMYSRCGCWYEASRIFNLSPEPDLIMWNTVIWGASLNGHSSTAIHLFKRLESTNLIPNHSTFSGVLLACNYGGLKDTGSYYYKHMTRFYGLEPRPDHCASMISLLGRCGQLEEAVTLMQRTPFEPMSAMWGALLGVCTIHGNVEWGKKAAESLFLMEPLNPTPYVQLANIYASAGMWTEAAKTRKEMKTRGVKKVKGCSWIEVGTGAIFFTAGDRSHAKSPEIYEKLCKLIEEIKAIGYVPERSVVLQDLDDGEKEASLAQHSEKLALALGLLELPNGLPLRIVNNQRMCDDCHTAFTFISKIINRKITVRDANRFHNFQNGSCSCRNFY